MKKVLYILFFVSISYASVFAQTGVEISTEKVIIEGQKFYLHTVAQGNTIYSICKAYGISEDELNEVNFEISGSALQVGRVLKIPVINEVSADGKHIIYTVKPGDTLYSLCRKYGIAEIDFYTINPDIKQGKPLKVGQEIKFPYAIVEDKILDQTKDTVNFYYHLVEKGETIYGITRIYDVTKEEIIALNPDFDGVRILVGDVLKIPKKSGILINNNAQIIDSIANVNYVAEELEIKSEKFCKESNWYKNGENFEVIILMPFEAAANMRSLYNQTGSNRDQRLYLTTEKIVSFYSGCLIAMDKFKTLDVKINVKVYDVGKDNSVISSLIDSKKLLSADLIIGPAFKSQIEYLNANLQNPEVVVIIPFVNDSELLEKFERNIMIKPSTDMIIDGIASYAALQPQNNYFVIQGSTAEQIMLAEKYHSSLKSKLGEAGKVEIIKFGGKNLAGVKNVVSKDKENVFIMPFNTETSCTNVFLNLFPLKDYEITLIGDQGILEYETIDPSYYAKVKFSYYSGMCVDYNDDDTQKFLSDYKETFLCEPDDNAFIAYDAVSYYFLKLIRHGNNFCSCIPDDNVFKGISGKQVYQVGTNFSKSSFSNSTIYIYALQNDYSFKKIFPVLEE